jgi:flagellar biosynthetic protein FliR
MASLAMGLIEQASPYVIPAARTMGVVAFMPGFSSNQVPSYMRVALAMGVAFLVAGTAKPTDPFSGTPEQLVLTLAGELALGMIVGWAVYVFFEAVRWAGELLDLQLGLRAGSLFDPISNQSSSLLGQVYYLTALTFFFVTDGHHWVLAAVARSFDRIPPGGLVMGAGTTDLLVGAAASSLDIGIRVGAVGICALLLSDIALAIVGRHVPQMNVFLVGIPGKLWAGMIVLGLSAPLLGGAFTVMMQDIRRVVSLLLGG